MEEQIPQLFALRESEGLAEKEMDFASVLRAKASALFKTTAFKREDFLQ